MINCINLMGRLVDDPKAKTANDKEVSAFSIAVNDWVAGKEVAYFFTCSAFGKTAERINKLAKKGTMVFLTGKLVQRHWVKKDNPDVKITTHEIWVNDIDFALLPKKPEAKAEESEYTEAE